MLFSIMLACWLLMQESYQLKWCQVAELPEHMQNICTKIGEIEFNVKPPEKNIHVENKKFNQLVRRSLFAKTKKKMLPEDDTTYTNKRKKEIKHWLEECKENKKSCSHTKITIGTSLKEKCTKDNVDCDQVLLSTAKPGKCNKGKKNMLNLNKKKAKLNKANAL